MEYVKIRKGFLDGVVIADQIFPLLKPLKTGRNGFFVTVENNNDGVKSPARIHVPDEDAVMSVTAEEAVTGVVAAEETDEQILTRINSRFATLEQMTQAVAEGHIYGLVVSGPGGVGKSFGVKKVLRNIDAMQVAAQQEARIKKVFGDDRMILNEQPHVIHPGHQIITGYMRAVGIYKALYDYQARCQVTVFDDCDSVMEDETSLNILKAALDTEEERLITYGSETNALQGYEKRFTYRGGAIYITNKKFDTVRENGAMGEHLAAIMTRCHYLDLTLDTPRAKFLRIKQVVKSFGMLRNEGFSEADENMVLDFIAENKDNLRDLSLRMAIKIADIIRIDRMNWRATARQTCMKRM